MFKEHAKNQEKIRSLSHQTRNLCLQGKRDQFGGKVRISVQTYIGGGPCLVRLGPCHAQARPRPGQATCCLDGTCPWVFQTIPMANPSPPRTKSNPNIEFSSSNRAFLIKKIQNLAGFCVPVPATRKVRGMPRMVPSTESKLRSKFCRTTQ